MKRPNILLIGNSGAGKSTLINAVLDRNAAKTSLGERGTERMDIYESPGVPFRLIDTRGMEYSLMAQMSARRQIERWTKENLENDRSVNMIWYCVDAMSARLFSYNIKMLRSVTKFWKDIPVIVVLTKSYSAPRRTEYENMVYDQILKYAKGKVNVKDVISVVAKEMPISDEMIVPPYGLTTLIDRTVSLTPEALRLSEEAVDRYRLRMKRKAAMSFTAAVTTGSAVVGASPVPVADAAVLIPMQTGLVKGIARIYGADTGRKDIIGIIVECGTVSTAARAAVSSLKAVFPVAGNLINAVVAAVFSAAIGEITILVMEKFRTGEMDERSLSEVREYTEERFSGIIDRILPHLKDLRPEDLRDMKKVAAFIMKIISKH